MRKSLLLAGAALAAIPGFVSAANLITSTDPIIAIDFDLQPSSFPGGEPPANAIDGTNNKYLNFGKLGSGFIVTPAAVSTVQSFQITTANDAEERDPASYSLFGTNDAITSASNSKGDAENWTLISSGALSLPALRTTLGDPVDFSNFTPYTSYKIHFPTVKNANTANSMQIAEIQMYEGPSATGIPILSPGRPVVAVDNIDASQSSHPGGEAPPLAIDNNNGTKYLNFGEENSGVIVTLAGNGPGVARGLKLVTAGDAPDRDPTSYTIWGTNDPITSQNNSLGNGENWVQIATGALNLPAARGAESDIAVFDNATAYSSYRIVFPTVKNAGATNSMQVAEIQLLDVNSIPEPTTLGILGVGLATLVVRRRK